MTRSNTTRRHTTHWPDGTPRSQQNAFTQHARHHALGIDSIIAAEYQNCTSLYNNWRSAQRSGHGKGAHMTWPQYRDSEAPKTKDFAYRDPGGQTNGFGANGGTLVGLSDKADALLAKQGKLMPVTGVRWNGGAATAPHGGAYSKAGTEGGSSRIYTPKKSAKPKANPAQEPARRRRATEAA